MLLLKSFSFFLRFWSKTTEFLAQAIDLFCLRRKRIISANYPYNILCKELGGCVVVSFRRGDKEARKVETSSKNHGFLLWSRFLFLLYGWSKEQKQKELTLRANSLQFIYSYAMVYRSWRCGVCRLSLGDHSPYVWCVPLHDGDEEDVADSSDVPQHNGRHH